MAFSLLQTGAAQASGGSPATVTITTTLGSIIVCVGMSNRSIANTTMPAGFNVTESVDGVLATQSVQIAIGVGQGISQGITVDTATGISACAVMEFDRKGLSVGSAPDESNVTNEGVAVTSLALGPCKAYYLGGVCIAGVALNGTITNEAVDSGFTLVGDATFDQFIAAYKLEPDTGTDQSLTFSWTTARTVTGCIDQLIHRKHPDNNYAPTLRPRPFAPGIAR